MAEPRETVYNPEPGEYGNTLLHAGSEGLLWTNARREVDMKEVLQTYKGFSRGASVSLLITQGGGVKWIQVQAAKS